MYIHNTLMDTNELVGQLGRRGTCKVRIFETPTAYKNLSSFHPNDQQQIPIENHETTQSSSLSQQGRASFQVFNEIQPWDRCAVEVQVAEVAFQRLIHFLPSTGSPRTWNGPKGSALVCGYTNYHRQLESSLADLQKKEGKGLPSLSNRVCSQYGIDGNNRKYCLSSGHGQKTFRGRKDCHIF